MRTPEELLEDNIEITNWSYEQVAERSNWSYIYGVPKEKRSRELCMIAIRKSKHAIAFVPEEYEDIHKMWEIMYG